MLERVSPTCQKLSFLFVLLKDAFFSEESAVRHEIVLSYPVTDLTNLCNPYFLKLAVDQ